MNTEVFKGIASGSTKVAPSRLWASRSCRTWDAESAAAFVSQRSRSTSVLWIDTRNADQSTDSPRASRASAFWCWPFAHISACNSFLALVCQGNVLRPISFCTSACTPDRTWSMFAAAPWISSTDWTTWAASGGSKRARTSNKAELAARGEASVQELLHCQGIFLSSRKGWSLINN